MISSDLIWGTYVYLYIITIVYVYVPGNFLSFVLVAERRKKCHKDMS